jgi:DNA replication and repair protein RecF
LEAFEQVMAPLADSIHRARSALIGVLDDSLSGFYSGLCGGSETAGFQYRPDTSVDGSEQWLELYRSGRLRDRQVRATQKGPHRDDFRFLLEDRDAQEFASEGQQRGLVLALRFAQWGTTRRKKGITPIVLADDVLGELDPERRERFWCHLEPDTQVIASGTELPESGEYRDWRVFQAKAGRFRPEPGPR